MYILFNSRFTSYNKNTYLFKEHNRTVKLQNLSSVNLVSIFRCSSPPRNPVYPRRVDPSVIPWHLVHW